MRTKVRLIADDGGTRVEQVDDEVVGDLDAYCRRASAEEGVGRVELLSPGGRFVVAYEDGEHAPAKMGEPPGKFRWTPRDLREV